MRKKHVSILIDGWEKECKCDNIKLKQASYNFKITKNYYTIMLENMLEYIRIIFDLYAINTTMDLISFNKELFTSKNIDKNNYNVILNELNYPEQTNMNGLHLVKAIEKYLLSIPRSLKKFYNNYTPFESNLNKPVSDAIFLLRNQNNGLFYYNVKPHKSPKSPKSPSKDGDNDIKMDNNNDIKIENSNIDDSDKTIPNKYILNILDLIDQVRVKNRAIKNVYVIHIDEGNEIKTKWTRYNENIHSSSRIKEESKDMDEDIDILTTKLNNNDINAYSCVVGIHGLNQVLTQLICDLQFKYVIKRFDITNVPYLVPGTKQKTHLSIPMFMCINNIHGNMLYNETHFGSNECEILNESDNFNKLSWIKKLPDINDWIPNKIYSISLAKMDENSRLLIKFLSKKGIAGLKRENTDGNKATHVIKLIGTKLVLLNVINDEHNNNSNMIMSNKMLIRYNITTNNSNYSFNNIEKNDNIMKQLLSNQSICDIKLNKFNNEQLLSTKLMNDTSQLILNDHLIQKYAVKGFISQENGDYKGESKRIQQSLYDMIFN